LFAPLINSRGTEINGPFKPNAPLVLDDFDLWTNDLFSRVFLKTYSLYSNFKALILFSKYLNESVVI
jgi:hypothetical protein